jgi:hypothetical protein
MDPATIRFRLTLPYALFPASPPLAALHAARARTLHPDHLPSDTPPCSRCGSLLVHHLRAFKNKKQNNRILRRSCPICGAVIDTPLSIVSFPPVRNHGTKTITPPLPVAVEPSPPSPPKSLSPVPPKQQSRPKKKSGLQYLLAHNRENEERERQKQNQSNNSQLGGLAAFLSDL